jgi:hypothetical protein
MTELTQQERILAQLEAGRCVTPLSALRDFHCFRLGARIYNLKREGHTITTTLKADREGHRFAEYRLEARA